MKNLDDNALFEKICRESSLTAYEVLFDRYWLKLYAAAKSRLQDEDEAKDCVQEIFVINFFRCIHKLPAQKQAQKCYDK